MSALVAAEVMKENQRLRRALKPFAKLCEVFDGKQDGLAKHSQDGIYKFNDTSITLGHLRAASKALARREK